MNIELNNLPKLVLITNGYNVLTAYKQEHEFIIIDEHDKIIATLNTLEIIDFKNGNKGLFSSKGEMIFFDSYSEKIRVNDYTFDGFIFG